MTLEYKLESAGEHNDLMLGYFMSSSFHQYLRHTYSHFHQFTEQEKSTLVRNAELFRVKQDHTTMLINYSQPTFSVIVYGELRLKGKVYTKGMYFGNEKQKIQINFIKKSAVMMLNKEELQKTLLEYELFYTKKSIIQKILPTQGLGLHKRSFKILCQHAVMVTNTSIPPYLLEFNDEPGVYFFYQGTYALLNPRGIKISELTVDSFGEECLWGEVSKYTIRPETYQHKYLWLQKSFLLQVLSPQAIQKLIQITEKRHFLRSEIQRKCEQTRLKVEPCLKGKDHNKITKKFSSQQIKQFHQILGKMSKRGYKPKWKKQDELRQAQRRQQMKKKRIYVPQKSKSKYFSTLKEKAFDQNFYQKLHREQMDPYQIKLYLHERAPSQKVFNRRSKTQQIQIKPLNETHQERMSKTSHSYYSHNYDRSYSTGMTNLIKMKQYQEMKKRSTLKRGEKILSMAQLTEALKVSFNQLNSTMVCNSHQRKMDPNEFFQKTAKRNSLLVKRLMQSKGSATWR